MPINLKLKVANYVPSAEDTFKITNAMPGKEDQEFDLSFTNMTIDVAAGKAATMTVTFVVMNLDMLLEAIELSNLAGINLFLICPFCRGKMEQLHNGDWTCGCETRLASDPNGVT